jgi:hypothetical protein
MNCEYSDLAMTAIALYGDITERSDQEIQARDREIRSLRQVGSQARRPATESNRI